jgi:alpha-1,3-glucosyltransferase
MRVQTSSLHHPMRIFLIICLFKLLLLYSYKSTDYHVHRNWMSITRNLPCKDWYVDTTSPHTLDYPPFFAWFEYLLSFGCPIDPKMCEIGQIDYDSFASLLYMRCTVFVSDLIFYLSLKWVCKDLNDVLKVFLLPALIIIDNIHFQYNGILFGFFTLSYGLIKNGKYMYLSGTVFISLIFWKHLFVYMGPAYLVYFLKNNVNLIYASMISACVTITAFLPGFGIKNVLSRLFPFQRGLTHTYWAPNVWSLYNSFEVFVLKNKMLTQGLTGVYFFDIKPIYTNVLCLTSLFVYFLPSTAHFLEYVIYSCFVFFIFGYHVHEKAILMILIPLGLLSLENSKWRRIFHFLNIIGTWSVFPLLFRREEYLLKWTLLFLYIAYHFEEINFSKIEWIYIAVIPIIELAHFKQYPFLNLILVSNYATICNIYGWIQCIRLSMEPITDRDNLTNKSQ